MLIQSHLRPAAIAVGVLKADDKRRFGFHSLRHSIATFLVSVGTDVKTVQALLRHSDPKLTLEWYTHQTQAGGMAAQGKVFEAMFSTPGGTVH
jgi:site-specific recombinase XerD